MSHKYIYWKWGTGELMNKSLRETSKNIINTEEEKETTFITQRLDDRKQNTRELNSARMCQRDMVIQTSINPFLASNNYIDDLDIQSQYLRPKDSNIKAEEE